MVVSILVLPFSKMTPRASVSDAGPRKVNDPRLNAHCLIRPTLLTSQRRPVTMPLHSRVRFEVLVSPILG
jgi:hypothetical protein